MLFVLCLVVVGEKCCYCFGESHFPCMDGEVQLLCEMFYFGELFEFGNFISKLGKKAYQ